ncbi:MAG: histidine phosphatase family protein [Simkaniaceae bacterium]
MKEFYFVRHGQTDVNTGLLRGDHPHVPLNEIGISQIKRLKENFPDISFRKVCRSPMKRVIQTASILLDEADFSPHDVIEELSECSWNTWVQMEALNFSLKEDHSYRELKEFLSRTERATELLLNNHEPFLVVAHGGIFNALLHHLDIEWTYNVNNGELIHFYQDPDWKIKSLFTP